MDAESGFVLEHRETGRRYRPVGCLHIFKSIESASLFREVGFSEDGDKDWCVRPAIVEMDDEVDEAEVIEALERVKEDGKEKITEART